MSSKPPFPLVSPSPLSLLCEVEVVRLLHPRADQMEKDYFEKWRENQLNSTNRNVEETLNIRSSNVDTEEIVLKYKSREAETIKKKREDWENNIAKKHLKLYRKTGGKRKKPPIHWQQNLQYKTGHRLLQGIPEGVDDTEYITYRKCKYIEDIKKVRNYLHKNLTAGALNNLMDTMYNIAKFNDKHEHGLLTLQAMLTTKCTKDFRIASAKFHKNFTVQTNPFSSSHHGGSLFIMEKEQVQLEAIETRIGTTILHYTLKDGGAGLTHLSLVGCACDSLVKVISDVCVNLRFLNVSGSVVTDQALFYLCGVDRASQEAVRPSLPRRCKDNKAALKRESTIVKNKRPNWVKEPGKGCENLEHFHGLNLDRIVWPGQAIVKYYDHQEIPLDCGFVAMLLHLPRLKSLVTEVGVRAVYAYAKLKREELLDDLDPCSSPDVKMQLRSGKMKQRRNKRYTPYKPQPSPVDFSSVPTLNLEILSENHLMPYMASLLPLLCPNLVRLDVDWYEFYTHLNNGGREDWINEIHHCKHIQHLITSEIDFKTPNMKSFLSISGCNLTVLDLKEIWSFRYSLFHQVKVHCPNLVELSICMTTRSVMQSINHVIVDKDHNLQLNADHSFSLGQLEFFQLHGPFGHEVVSYLVKGANKLKSLTLGIEWIDPNFCDNQPQTRKDLLGQEYLQEVINANPNIVNLQEMHLLAQYRRGRGRLTKPFAIFILDTFRKLTHFGSFQFWSMRPDEVESIIAQCVSTNRGITFDEDLHSCSTERAYFEYKHIKDRHRFGCHRIGIKKESSNLLTEFFDVLAGVGNGQDIWIDGSSSDEEDDEEDDEDDDLDVEDQGEDGILLESDDDNGPDDDICVIM